MLQTIVMSVVFGIVLAALIGPLLYAWWKDRRSRAWPITYATVLSGTVSPAYRRSYSVELSYSYSVEGSLYLDSFKIQLPEEEGAKRLQAEWSASKLPVRYNPTRPAESYLDPFRSGERLTDGLK